jgi:hypothetical protein
MAQRYAKGTTVSVRSSVQQVEKLLAQHGASGFVYGWDEASRGTRIMCRIEGKMLRFEVTKPHVSEFKETEKGRARAPDAAKRACEAEERRRWRVLVLLIKAKFEAIETGYTSIEKEFLADLVLPNGSTVHDWASKQIENAYNSGKMPSLLPGVAPK